MICTLIAPKLSSSPEKKDTKSHECKKNGIFQLRKRCKKQKYIPGSLLNDTCISQKKKTETFSRLGELSSRTRVRFRFAGLSLSVELCA